MGNRRCFHFNRYGLREVVADFRQPDRPVDEGVTADDQAAHRVQIQRFDTALRSGNQLIVGFEACRAAWQLAILITKGGDIGIVVACLVGDDDVADFQRRRQSTCGAGVDNHVRLANLQQQGCAHRGRHFANTRFQQSDLGAVQLAGINFASAKGQRLTVFDFVAQKGNFFFHSANNADFHRFTRDVSGLVA